MELNLYYHSRAIEHFSAMYKASARLRLLASRALALSLSLYCARAQTLQAIDAEADAATIARKLTELGQTRVVDDTDK